MPRSDRDYRTIGEVVDGLSETYPDLTVSKLRFLEDEGLIAPARTSGGYRKFTEEDVARIELVLRMQRDQFLPLAVIRERLEQSGGGDSLGAVEAARLPIEDAGTVRLADAPREFGGAPPEFVRELARYGLIEMIGTGEDAEIQTSDGDLVSEAWHLRQFGVEPRHLKMFDQFAEREAALLEQVLMPAVRLRTPEARQRAVRQLDELTRAMHEVKQRLLERSLRETFEDVT
jgi:DNA-binding transcriptional MerR regulator